MNEITVPEKLIDYIMKNPKNKRGIRDKIILFCGDVADEYFSAGYAKATETAERHLNEIANHAQDCVYLLHTEKNVNDPALPF